MKKTVLCFTLLVASPSVFAGGIYFGAGLGTTKADDADINVRNIKRVLSEAGATTDITYDTQANAASLALGYHVNDNIDIELGYDYLGTYDLTGTMKAGGTTFKATERNKVSAVSLSGIFSLKLSQKISIHTRIGLASTTNESTCQTNFSSSCDGDSDSGTGAIFGLGGTYKTSGHSALRAEYIQFNDVGNTENQYTAGSFSTIKLSYIYTP